MKTVRNMFIQWNWALGSRSQKGLRIDLDMYLYEEDTRGDRGFRWDSETDFLKASKISHLY